MLKNADISCSGGTFWDVLKFTGAAFPCLYFALHLSKKNKKNQLQRHNNEQEKSKRQQTSHQKQRWAFSSFGCRPVGLHRALTCDLFWHFISLAASPPWSTRIALCRAAEESTLQGGTKQQQRARGLKPTDQMNKCNVCKYPCVFG